MDETTYYQHAKAAFRKVEEALDALGDDTVDFERAGDVLTITFPSGKKCVLNTQRPTRQLWLAADAKGWHFVLDGATGLWVDEKGTGAELYAQLSEIARAHVGRPLPF